MNTNAFPIGARADLSVTITEQMVTEFAELSQDFNPLHIDESEARKAGFPRRVGHGVLTLSFVSALIGTKMPGKGALWRSLTVDWLQPVFPGDTLEITAEVKGASTAHDTLLLNILARNQNNAVILRADATVGMTHESILSDAKTEPEDRTAHRPSLFKARQPNRDGKEAWGSSSRTRPVLVTGGSRGIGRAVATRLGSDGYPVLVGFRKSSEQADEVVAEIEAMGGEAKAFGLDLEDSRDVQTALCSLDDMLGPPLALVHCASPALDASTIKELTPDRMDRFWRVYVTSALAICQKLQFSIQRYGWGRVVFIGTSALIGTPPLRMIPYLTAKSALWGFTRTLAVELGPSGATSNMISPSLTMTDLVSGVSERTRLLEARRNPRRRLAEAQDTAQVVNFLMSDGASFVNGVNLPVTGGSGML